MARDSPNDVIVFALHLYHAAEVPRAKAFFVSYGTERHALAQLPRQLPPAEEMEVQMPHHLSALFAGVHSDAVARRGDTFGSGQLDSDTKNIRDQAEIITLNSVHVVEVFNRDDDDMHRRLGVDIAEGNDLIVSK